MDDTVGGHGRTGPGGHGERDPGGERRSDPSGGSGEDRPGEGPGVPERAGVPGSAGVSGSTGGAGQAGVPELLTAAHRLALSDRPQSAAQARRYLSRELQDCGLDELAEVAALLVSELVTNALQHGDRPGELRVATRERTLTVGVTDHSFRVPAAAPPPDDVTVPSERRRAAEVLTRPSDPAAGPPRYAELDFDGLPDGGRGLVLVDALAQDWGWTELPEGKLVWFRLSAS